MNRYIFKAFLAVVVIMILGIICLPAFINRNDPYAQGMHFDYSIICENGFKYKVLDQRRGVIPLLNKDGSRMKCKPGEYGN